jgi:YebC/PmpR family DNA-binding regulatory protein
MGHHQAQEGRHRRPARQAVRQADQEHRGGGATRWGDPAANPTLYDAIQKAKKTSVPNDNIDRAVKRGSGAEAGASDWEPITYEGYAPGGVAILIECLTDNRNRAAAEVRTALTRNGGQLADPGSVAYVFNRKGVVIVPKEQAEGEATEDAVLEVVLDAGAEEVNDNGETWEIISEATDLVAVRQAIQDAGIDYDSAEASFVPNLQVPLDLDGAKKMIRVIDALEDSDDVQNVYANGDIPDDVLAQLDEED